jgi:hypothetical protein
MSDLRAELNAVLQAVEPGPPPVDAVMWRGRRLKSRRRLAVRAAALAVAAIAVAGYLTQSHEAAPKPPLQTALPRTAPRPSGITVTPGFWSGEGVIAVGTVNGEHWRLSVTYRGTARCFTGTVGTASLGSVCDVVPPLDAGPVAWHVLSEGTNQVLITGVAPDVTYVVVTTAGGQQLKLIPVTARGHGDRFVGIVDPQDLNVISMHAYLADGQRVAVAEFSPPGWTGPGGASAPHPVFALGPLQATASEWLATAQAGPWGTCIGTGDVAAPRTLSCTTAATMTTLTALGVANASDGSPTVVYGSAPPAAVMLLVTLANGQRLKVPVITVGIEKLWAFALGAGQVVKSWTAFSSAGKPLGTGGQP